MAMSGFQGAIGSAMQGFYYTPQSPIGLQAIQNIGPAAMGGLVSPQTPVLGALTRGAMGRAEAMSAIGQVTFPGGGGPLGMGFGAGQREQIYQQMRQQTELPKATMSELAQIVGAGAQMGQFTAVHSVQQFKQQFSELLQAVKTVTSTLGVALSDAAQMLQQMSSLGFKGQAGAGFLTNLQGAAYSAGVSPVAMMQFMAPMAGQMRQAGGTGIKQGLVASQKFLEAFGTAYETGLVGDEALQQATGQVGGAGIQALGQSYLTRAAHRMRHTGRGGYITAALLDPTTGGIDPAMLGALQSGVMDPAMVQREGNRRAHQYGQANWVANRNRLAGQVMEADPFAEMQFYRTYLQQKGTDIGSSRGQIMMSRLTGMSMDEVQGMLPMMQSLDQTRMIEQVREAQSRLVSQKNEQISNRASPEFIRKIQDRVRGFTRKLEDVGAGVQRTLEQMMIDQFESSIGSVETWLSPDILKIQGAPGGMQRVAQMDQTLRQFARGGTAGPSGGATMGAGGIGLLANKGRSGVEGQQLAMMQLMNQQGSLFQGLLGGGAAPEGVSAGRWSRLQREAGTSLQAMSMFGFNEEGLYRAGLPQETMRSLREWRTFGNTAEGKAYNEAAQRRGKPMETTEKQAAQFLVPQIRGMVKMDDTARDFFFTQQDRAQRYAEGRAQEGQGVGTFALELGKSMIGMDSQIRSMLQNKFPNMSTSQAWQRTAREAISGNRTITMTVPTRDGKGKQINIGGDILQRALQSGSFTEYSKVLTDAAAQQVALDMLPDIERFGNLQEEYTSLVKSAATAGGAGASSSVRDVMSQAADLVGWKVGRFTEFARTNQAMVGRIMEGTGGKLMAEKDVLSLQDAAFGDVGGADKTNERDVYISMLERKFPNMTAREREDMADSAGMLADKYDASAVTNAFTATTMIPLVGATMTREQTTAIYKEMFGGKSIDPATGQPRTPQEVAASLRNSPGMAGIASAIEQAATSGDPSAVGGLIDQVFKGGDRKEIERRLGLIGATGYNAISPAVAAAQYSVGFLKGGRGQGERQVETRKKGLLQALQNIGVDTSSLANASIEQIARVAEGTLGTEGGGQSGDILKYLQGGKGGGAWTREEQLQQFGRGALRGGVSSEQQRRNEEERRRTESEAERTATAKAYAREMHATPQPVSGTLTLTGEVPAAPVAGVITPPAEGPAPGP